MIPYSQLRHQPRIDLASAIPLPGPMTIHVEPGNACNFKCTFCPESFADYREKAGGLHMLKVEDFATVVRQIDILGRLKVMNMHMMGEPFANKNLEQMFKMAKQADIADKVICTTNGTLLRENRWQTVCESGLDYLRVSIYGCTQKAHEERTQSSVPLKTVIDNVRGLKTCRDSHGFTTPFICVKYVSSSPCEDHMFRLMFADAGDETHVEALHNWHDPEEKNLAGIPTEELLSQPNFAKKKEVCPFPFYTLIIHADLQVGVCCVDWSKKTIVGNLRTQTLFDIWHGQKLRDFRLMHIRRRRSENEACSNCTYLHTLTDNVDSVAEDRI
jgi:radical SAM protein with 4Fe4S-binding SPASM domain